MSNSDVVQIEEYKEAQSSRRGISFYSKLLLMYLLNIVDWICTEALLASGRFYEVNPIMAPVLGGFWQTVMIKGIVPLMLILFCGAIYRLVGEKGGFLPNLLLNFGLTVYALVNLWHIFNFVLLFFVF